MLRVPGGLDYSHTVDLPPDVDEKEDILYVKDKYPIHSNILQASSDYHLDRNSISAAGKLLGNSKLLGKFTGIYQHLWTA